MDHITWDKSLAAFAASLHDAPVEIVESLWTAIVKNSLRNEIANNEYLDFVQVVYNERLRRGIFDV